MIEVRISDNGPGIPESELEPLRAGKEEPVVHLSGLGLWFVVWTVRHSGGDIDFETEEQAGTTVILRVPRAIDVPELTRSYLTSLWAGWWQRRGGR